MRLASLETDYWQLRSGEESHAANPDTFWIPPIEQRSGLKRGQAAKLIFEIEVEGEAGAVEVDGERMWVIVAETIGEFYIGILDNKPVGFEPSEEAYLCFGAEIPFKAEHVVDIGEPPAEYSEWQLSQPPERRWPRD